MGAWGHGIFDDDTAYDVVDDLCRDPLAYLASTFAAADTSERLDHDRCHAVTVSAAYLDNLLHGTTFRTDHGDATDERNVNRFGALHPELVAAGEALRPAAARALARVLGDASELRELWSDNVALYPRWRDSLEQVMRRLAG